MPDSDSLDGGSELVHTVSRLVDRPFSLGRPTFHNDNVTGIPVRVNDRFGSIRVIALDHLAIDQT